jgi:biopolymer transport protein ExbD
MIDIVFLLIIFFMVVAQISRQRVVEVELPGFDPSAARVLVRDGVVALNVVPESERTRLGGAYSLGGVVFGDDAGARVRLVGAIRGVLAASPGVELVIRADQSERYELVDGAMLAAREAGATRVHLASLSEGDVRKGGGR